MYVCVCMYSCLSDRADPDKEKGRQTARQPDSQPCPETYSQAVGQQRGERELQTSPFDRQTPHTM